MPKQDFTQLLDKIAETIAQDALDEGLEAKLNRDFPPSSDTFQTLARLCAEGERDGWLMAREAGGIRFGRAIKPGEIAGDFSVDVVRMKDVRGPHHVHTTGEIGAIIPLEGAPQFDGKGEGWYVYGPGSDHHPTVSGGDAYILYLLPEGAIEFTGK
ncbi:DUF4863 family protein [Ruegeria sp.]|uniref:4-hydroxylaminobenzoate lyase n=1 Tax=Ruegeria sp. TaxID=1879320 RepID=UPI002313245F|nr:DUF4863 family protein [Ruegeria sp.]MDA7965067.1 DUF4863 family protein [Ruegeria sp.]